MQGTNFFLKQLWPLTVLKEYQGHCLDQTEKGIPSTDVKTDKPRFNTLAKVSPAISAEVTAVQQNNIDDLYVPNVCYKLQTYICVFASC